MTIIVRPATLGDASELCALLNEIIKIGCTTAHETQLTHAEFADHFLRGERYICCHVAVDEHGALGGFQALKTNPRLPDNWGDIATFARAKPKMPGVGSTLFPHTLDFARHAGLVSINATIRADNRGGLAYYEKVGFDTYRMDEAVPLTNGTSVDRISKKFLID